MQTAFFRTAGLAGLLLVVACGPSQTAEPQAASPSAGTASPDATDDLFRREAGLDYFGYYMADDSEIFGDWRLHHMFVGDVMMFTDFEAAGEPEGEAPVWLEFWPVGGETAVNELGQEYAVGAHRVRADRYVIESGRFEFRAEDPEVGPVLLSGMIRPGAIANPASGPGFTGGMEVDGDRHRNMSLHYFAGE